MKFKHIKNFKALIFIFSLMLCANTNGFSQNFKIKILNQKDISTGAQQIEKYIDFLSNKNVAIVANHSSLIEKTHLVDSLLSLKIKIKKIFCPEHGFRGNKDAGENIENYVDKKTNIPVISLYGKKKKPENIDLKDIDIVVFDIQDVGARFYTYISTLYYVMQACAENKIEVLVLDRPNPNGYYVDGPIIKKELMSFVGLLPLPIVHGMTIGELSLYINNELLKEKIRNLNVIKVLNYDHTCTYELPVAPSPNLKTLRSILLYPSICLFEGTPVSVGRGTQKPFEYIGHPMLKKYKFQFTPKKSEISKNPLLENKVCRGIDLSTIDIDTILAYRNIQLKWIINFYKDYPNKNDFFSMFFNKLSGDTTLQYMIRKGYTETQIRKSWKNELDSFKVIRKKYLLYKDFE